MTEFSLRSERVLLNSDVAPQPAQVFVRDGKISAIETPGGRATYELGNQVLMPGIIDSHAHINEPGRTEWEGFESATRAAAAGGITTVVDMPLNSIPPTTTLWALKEKAQAAAGHCRIDYAFWGGLVRDNVNELIPMTEAGVRGFKAFLIDSGVAEFAWTREPELRRGMETLAQLKVPLLAHAEIDLGATLEGNNPREYRHYLSSRPARWEVQAIRLLIKLSKETGCAVHVVHLSAAEALTAIAEAKTAGIAITAETCPHYLALTSETIPEGATAFKCAPPIRDGANREQLWRGLSDGTLDMIVSDHSPCTPALKGLENGNFPDAWGGIAGLQFSLPVIWTEMRERKLPLEKVVKWMIEGPARLIGLSTRKGRIAVGWDADLVAWDPDAKFVVEETMIRHRHKVTPYLGRELFGQVLQTWLRGELVFDRGNFSDEMTGERV